MLPRALALLCLLAAPLAAQENIFGHQPDPKSKTRIEAVALFSRPAPGGFLPVRVTVTNANEADGNIELRCTASDSSYSGEQGSQMASSFKLSAPAGKTTRHDVLVPCNTLLNYARGSDGTMEVTVNMSGSFGGSSGKLSSAYQDSQPALLMSNTLYTPNASMLDSELSRRGGMHGAGISFAGKFDPLEMPEDWRAYSGYDGITLTDTDWKTLSPGARTAILRWNRLGGRLVILATTASSDLATLGISNFASGEKAATRSFGSVVIDRLDSPTFTLDSAGANTLINRFTSKDNLTPVNHAIRNDFSTNWPLHNSFDPKSYNYGLFIVILIAFGILVGPVNLFVFAKSGRRHRLFITTPLIALATSVLLVALIILIDGFGGRGIRVALMEVRPDDGENSAYIYQEQISRTGVLLGASFTVNQPAAITPVPLSSDSQWSRMTSTNNGGGMRFESNLRDNKLEVEGDWFQSRSEQGQYLRAIVPTRGRMELRNGNGSPPSLVSTFDFKVDKLYYADSSGTIWYGENIEPGKPFTCREVSVGELNSFVAMASSKLSARSKEALTGVSPGQRGNRHFIAVSESAPGLDTFKGIDWTKTTTFITGPVATP